MSIRKGSKLEKIRIDANKVLKGIHCWIFNASSYHAVNLCQISEPTYIKLKNIIDELIGEREQEEIQIGGEGVEVQFDETAICNGLIIDNPSSVDDDIPGIQWILGGVEKDNFRNFVLKIIPNRKKETIFEFFKQYVRPGSIIVTDGYPSYPWAVRQFGSVHYVVNHSEGFSTQGGTNTNQIENLWSHLKQQYRAQGGVNKKRIKIFLNEFVWKKRNVNNYDPESLQSKFNHRH
jgi:transposase-like protein